MASRELQIIVLPFLLLGPMVGQTLAAGLLPAVETHTVDGDASGGDPCAEVGRLLDRNSRNVGGFALQQRVYMGSGSTGASGPIQIGTNPAGLTVSAMSLKFPEPPIIPYPQPVAVDAVDNVDLGRFW